MNDRDLGSGALVPRSTCNFRDSSLGDNLDGRALRVCQHRGPPGTTGHGKLDQDRQFGHSPSLMPISTKPARPTPPTQTACPIPSQPNRMAEQPVGHRSSPCRSVAAAETTWLCTTQHAFGIIKGKNFSGAIGLGSEVHLALPLLYGSSSRARPLGTAFALAPTPMQYGRGHEDISA